VQEFLDFSREQRLARIALPVADLFDEVLRSWQPLAAARGISVVIDLDKMRRVFDNLVKNAIEAIEDGPGTIRIRAARNGGDGVSIEVEDTGCGMPPDVDPFRLFQTSKRNGTGLGLPIVREIVQAHGGTVSLESGRTGGACFRVVLPFRDA
jgi:signal transduction histidine kinase